MRRFVPGPAAGDHRHPVALPIAAENDFYSRIPVQAHPFPGPTGVEQSIQRIGDNVFALIDKPLSEREESLSKRPVAICVEDS